MKKIKLFDPSVGIPEMSVIKNTLLSHFWASGAGKGKVAKFENEFKKYIGSDESVTVNSGTAALHLAVFLTNPKYKEIILPSLSFVSTAHSIIYNNAKPIFVDVDPKTLCIDPEIIKKSITKKTAAILPVHFAGMPCALDEIMDLCEEFKISLIEDAAHAAGTRYKKKLIGSHGTAACFSFHPVKNLAMPVGGAITLNGKNSEKFTKLLKSLRWCGISNRRGYNYDIADLGWNYYMNEFSAAIGLVQLKKLDKMNSKRKSIAFRYSKELSVEEKMPFNRDCSYHIYWIQVKNRHHFMKKMLEHNIETGIHYLPIHTMSYYRNKVKLPNTERVGKHIVSIPMHPNLNHSDIDRIIKITNKFS